LIYSTEQIPNVYINADMLTRRSENNGRIFHKFTPLMPQTKEHIIGQRWSI